MNKKFWLVAVFVVAVLLVFSAFWNFSKNETSKEAIISGHPFWPPIMYQQDDSIAGAGPEIVQKIFSELGIRSVSKYEGSWDVVQEKAKSGEIDVLVAAYKTAEREAYMDYSIPYTVDPVALVVKKGKSFSFERNEDLIGKNGVVTIGDSYGQDFDNFIKENLDPKKVETAEEAFSMLEKEEADYFVYALYAAENYIAKNNIPDQVEILPAYVSSENFYLTISKKSSFAKFLPQINSLLEKYKNDGTIDRIVEKNKQFLGQ